MLPIKVCDVLEILPDQREEIVLSGIPVEGDPEKNLCWKAYQLLKKHHDIPESYIHLLKLIPMGAGLGGGSSDAAHVLIALNNLYQLNLSSTELEAYAAELGSDCPFFIKSEPQIARGRGEILTPVEIDLQSYYLKIVNPGIHVGTAEAYVGVEPNSEVPSVRSIIGQPMDTWKSDLINDFEISVFKKYPEIGALKQKLYDEGAIYACMSGSGSTVFGIFAEHPNETCSPYFEKIIAL